MKTIFFCRRSKEKEEFLQLQKAEGIPPKGRGPAAPPSLPLHASHHPPPPNLAEFAARPPHPPGIILLIMRQPLVPNLFKIGGLKAGAASQPLEKVYVSAWPACGPPTYIFFLVKRDTLLLESFINYFGCGRYSTRSGERMGGDYIVTRFKDINEKIIPFFDYYTLQGLKRKDFVRRAGF